MFISWLIWFLGILQLLPDTDRVDQINYFWTAAGLLLSSIFTAGWSYVGSPIDCWFPAQYKKSWMQYATDLCFTKGTYFVPFFEQTLNMTVNNFGEKTMNPVPLDKNIQDQSSIPYYQWVPMILAFQALFFHLPVLIWRGLYQNGEMQVLSITDVFSWRTSADEETREKNTQVVGEFLTDKHKAEGWRTGWSRLFQGKYTLYAYLFSKILFTVNSIGQWWLLKHLLGVDSYTWGWDTAAALWNGFDIEEVAHFPRVTICDFTTRGLGTIDDHRIQCTLLINMFNEKIFMVQWFWLLAVFALNFASLCSWMITTLDRDHGIRMVTRFVSNFDRQGSAPRKMIKKFVETKLKPDGVFLLDLLAAHNGEVVIRDLIRYQWQAYSSDPNNNPPGCLSILSGIRKEGKEARVAESEV